MINNTVDGIKDYLTQGNVKIEDNENLSPLRYRCKLKSGVSILTTTGLTGIIWGIDRGLGNGVERNSTNGLACGEYITIFFYPNGNTFRNGYYISASNLSNFFSQFEIVYDSIPEYANPEAGNIKILSPDFISNVGLFDTLDFGGPFTNLNFSNSTFKVGPRIFTDSVMSEIQHFPPGVSSSNTSNFNPSVPWIPFANCPNITKIVNQGIFSNKLDALFPCNFTYYDSDGFGKLDAYPSGGSPIYIREFVQATKIRFSEPFPIFDSSRLKFSLNHFKIDSIVIDSVGGPVIPFGGVEFHNLDMEKMWIYSPNWSISLPLQQQLDLNITFGWGNLGIVAPNSCKDLSGLHTFWQNIAVYQSYLYPPISTDLNVATVEHLKTKVHYMWGSNLEQYLGIVGSDVLAEDYMPKVPTGILRSEGHYRKIFIGQENDVYSTPSLGSLLMRMKKDGQNFVYNPQRLPSTVKTAIAYCMNLYSDQEVNNDIFIPSLPSGMIYARDCYKRSFCNTVGPPTYLTPVESTPTVCIFWNKSGYTSSNPIYLISNANNVYNGDLVNHFNNSTARGFREYIPNQSGSGDDGTPTGRTAAWATFAEMMDFLKQPGQAAVELRLINTEINLEKNNFSSVQVAGNWQEECFFGAAIDPTKKDALIPLPSSNEWNSYKNSLNINFATSFGQPLYYWAGELEIPAENIFETRRTIHILIMLAYGTFTDAQFDTYRYNIDNVIMSGSPRTEGSSVLTPYLYATSKKTILGDRTNFLNSNNIVLNDPSTFSMGPGQAITQYVQISGSPLGMNCYLRNDTSHVNYKRIYFDFRCSYTPRSGGRFGQANLVPSTTFPYYFSNPFWVDSDGMRVGVMSEFTITNQSSLNSAMNTINANV